MVGVKVDQRIKLSNLLFLISSVSLRKDCMKKKGKKPRDDKSYLDKENYLYLDDVQNLKI